MEIELNLYQAKALVEMLESSETEDDPIILKEGDGHSGPGLYAYWRECPEEGAAFIGTDDEDQKRGDAIADLKERDVEWRAPE
ncbi:MAG: hypothetical protein AB1670_07785 [Pseudomonadota bacterium]